MEATSFVLSVASILQVFQACVRLYGDILSIRDRDEDVQAAYMLMQIELHTFRRLRNVFTQELSSPPHANTLCQGILGWMQDDLGRISDLLSHHATAGGTPASIATLSLSGAEPATKADKASKKIKRFAHSVTWIASDKERLKDLVTRLRQWNDGLAALVPEVKRRRVSYETMSECIASNSLSRLENIEHATETEYPFISQRAGLRRMTLRSRGNQGNSNLASLGKTRWKLSLDRFEWLPAAFQSAAATQCSIPNGIGVSEASSVEKAFAIYRDNETGSAGATLGSTVHAIPVMVEWRDDFRSEESFKQFEYRLEYLAKILHKMSGNELDQDRNPAFQDFRILPCLGWVTTTPRFDRIGLVFHLPRYTPEPSSQDVLLSSIPLVMSLHQWIRKTRREGSNAPALGERFNLAHTLALTLSNLFSVGWVHKEFRSHNILFMEDAANGSLMLSRPCLSGFTYARPSSNTSQDLSSLISDPAYDLYRPSMQVMFKHQQQQNKRMALDSSLDTCYNDYDSGEDNTRELDEGNTSSLTNAICWTSAMDIYGLGIILLEIGLWRTIQDLKGNRMSKVAFLNHTLDDIVESLSYRMGDLYRDVVKECLKLGDFVDDDKGLRNFWADTIENLGLCRA